MFGEGIIIELSSIYFKAAVSKPINMSYVTVLLPTNKLFGLPLLEDEVSETDELVLN